MNSRLIDQSHSLGRYLRQGLREKTPLIIHAVITSLILIGGVVSRGATNEFWISTNATHRFYDEQDASSMKRPLDGSNLANFQRNMSYLPENAIIHLLPGTYQSIGCLGTSNAIDGLVTDWKPKTGQKILGSGMDVTILQMPAKEMKTNGILHWASAGGGAAVIAGNWGYGRSNIDVCDLTLDCNYLPGSKCTLHGIQLEGSHLAIRRVKVINAAKFGGNSESWAIQISHGPTNSISEGNIIEGCEVSHYCGGNANLSGIWIVGNNISGILRSNSVYGELTQNTPLFAALGIGCGTASGPPSLIEGNHVEGAVNVLYAETGFTNLVVSNNVCLNCGTFISLHSDYVQNLSIISNTITLTNNIWNGGPGIFADFNPVATSQKPSFYTNINVTGNTITFVGKEQAESKLGCFLLSNVHGLTVANNQIDARLTNCFVNCSGLIFTNNVSINKN